MSAQPHAHRQKTASLGALCFALLCFAPLFSVSPLRLCSACAAAARPLARCFLQQQDTRMLCFFLVRRRRRDRPACCLACAAATASRPRSARATRRHSAHATTWRSPCRTSARCGARRRSTRRCSRPRSCSEEATTQLRCSRCGASVRFFCCGLLCQDRLALFFVLSPLLLLPPLLLWLCVSVCADTLRVRVRMSRAWLWRQRC